ncbi:MAG TPA: nickel-dependent hydrogenase large subunit, partial [Isosphaeraceae bacterium]|nr:nickel-dependent hydrogenase large subunit [Isosphaeraceae bacterium]
IRGGQIANYHPYPPTCWNASPRDSYGTPGPYEDAVQNTPIFKENGPEHFQGIDIMRTVRSFDPCLPCGVHMYLGGGRTIAVRHLPAFGVQPAPEGLAEAAPSPARSTIAGARGCAGEREAAP